MRILVLARDPVGRNPTQRFRFEQYVEPLRKCGIDLDFTPLLGDRAVDILYERGHVGRKVAAVATGAVKRLRQILGAGRYDAAFVSREAFPLGPPWVEAALRAARLPYVFDLDDAIWMPNASEANRMLAPLKFSRKARSVCRWAAAVTAGNAYLAAWASRCNEHVEVVPTAVDTERYRPRARQECGQITIGWSGSATTTPHLRLLDRVLAELQRRRDVRVIAVGAEPFASEAEIEFVPWTRAGELEQLHRFDVGVMPMPDDEWSRGKCGLKALLYMSVGVPTVTSPVGVGREIAEGGAALLADSDEAWLAALLRLAEDPLQRAQLGEAGRARVVERYSVAANVPRLDAVLRYAAERGPTAHEK